MRTSLMALLEGVIDYAGLFPPAKLSLEPALAQYIQHLNAPEGLLVDRFVCPALQLKELAEIGKALEPEEEIPVTATTSARDGQGSFVSSISDDFEVMQSVDELFNDVLWLAGYECSLPGDPRRWGEAMVPLILISESGPEVYAEVPWNDHVQDALAAIAETDSLFAKARTGGVTADAFPSSHQLAEFIVTCAQLELPFKMTAGLHHALPFQDPQLKVWHHGFINVLVASLLAYTEDQSRAEIQSVLEDTNPLSFRFDDQVIAYRGLEMPLDDVQELRKLFHTFGSCSVLEPVEDLKALGWWEDPA